jgi:hypothetical protein
MEWRIHQNLVHALEAEIAVQPSAEFTSAIMAKLPAPAKRRQSHEAVLLFALILAGLAATWFASDGLRQSLFAAGSEGAWLAALRAFIGQALSATVWKWQEALTNILGEQILRQGAQLLLITLVTAVVAKGAVLLDERLRRRLRGL